jgi:hypothetical protein
MTAAETRAVPCNTAPATDPGLVTDCVTAVTVAATDTRQWESR